MFSAKDRKVFIKTADDKLIDAATGKPFDGAAPDDLDNVARQQQPARRARRRQWRADSDGARSGQALRGGAGGVQVARRRGAAGGGQGADRREARRAVKKALNEARAAIVLTADDAAAAGQDRRHRRSFAPAATRIRWRLLEGLPADAPADVPRRRQPPPSTKIERNLAIWSTVQNAWYGLSLGSVLLLAAIGLAITFGVMGVINMAHGEMVMLGAYTTFVVQDLIRTSYPGLFDYSLLIARAAGFPGRGRRRHRHRAHGDPLPLRPPAGNAARHLGHLAGAAAGGAHRVRPDQPAKSATRPG